MPTCDNGTRAVLRKKNPMDFTVRETIAFKQTVFLRDIPVRFRAWALHPHAIFMGFFVDINSTSLRPGVFKNLVERKKLSSSYIIFIN